MNIQNIPRIDVAEFDALLQEYAAELARATDYVDETKYLAIVAFVQSRMEAAYKAGWQDRV